MEGEKEGRREGQGEEGLKKGGKENIDKVWKEREKYMKRN